jgi:hypothetical protein
VALTGGAQFRLLHSLYGQLFGGYSWDISRPEKGGEVGGGLRYDFGRVHIEALYNVFRPMADDQRIHQILAGVGFTF